MSDIDLIKSHLSIVDVVGEYVDLKPAGSRLKGLSPFTHEKTPSFFVTPELGLFHCFSTNKGGDIFTFIQEMEGVDFAGAIKILADKAGVELTGSRKKKQPTDELYAVLQEATNFFAAQLQASVAAKEFAQVRGMTDQTIKLFQIGYAPDSWSVLFEHLSKSFSEAIIQKAGLIKAGEAGKKPYDYFRNRLMFPIKDSAGRVVGFSGRRLDSSKVAKYLNSPETPIFNKSQVLYGFYEAKRSLRQFEYALLVEGQIDLVLCHQAGNTNTVASSGTAFTLEHLSLIKRYTNNLLLAFDSDPAGIRAALKIADLAFQSGLVVKMLPLPEGEDPADVINKDVEFWRSLVRQSAPVTVVASQYFKKTSRNKTNFRHLLQQEVLPLLTKIKSPLIFDQEIQELSEVVGVEKQILIQEIALLNEVKRSNQSSRRQNQVTREQGFSTSKTNYKKLSSQEKLLLIEKKLNSVRAWLQQKTPEDVPNLPEEIKFSDNSSQEVLRQDYREVKTALSTHQTLIEDWLRLRKVGDLEEQLEKLKEKLKSNSDPQTINEIINITGQLDKLR